SCGRFVVVDEQPAFVLLMGGEVLVELRLPDAGRCHCHVVHLRRGSPWSPTAWSRRSVARGRAESPEVMSRSSRRACRRIEAVYPYCDQDAGTPMIPYGENEPDAGTRTWKWGGRRWRLRRLPTWR